MVAQLVLSSPLARALLQLQLSPLIVLPLTAQSLLLLVLALALVLVLVLVLMPVLAHVLASVVVPALELAVVVAVVMVVVVPLQPMTTTVGPL